MMGARKNYVLILTSGGIDSTACICYYKRMKFNVEALFVDYGQIAKKKEIKAITLIAKYYKIKLNMITVKNTMAYTDGMILGRNAFLFFFALMNFKNAHGIIASGVHANTPYYDCSPMFIKDIQKIYDQYSQGTIKINAPFLHFNKKEIIQYCKLQKVPLKLTYSCELGLKQPCGKCATCRDLSAFYAASEKQ
jgi:7-cyano-7-deazaguanine synthase